MCFYLDEKIFRNFPEYNPDPIFSLQITSGSKTFKNYLYLSWSEILAEILISAKDATCSYFLINIKIFLKNFFRYNGDIASTIVISIVKGINIYDNNDFHILHGADSKNFLNYPTL